MRKFIPYSTHKSIGEETKMFDHFFKTCVAAVSDAEELNRMKDALSAAGIRYDGLWGKVIDQWNHKMVGDRSRKG